MPIDIYVRATVWIWPLQIMEVSLNEIRKIEANHVNDTPREVKGQHTAYGAGAIIASVSFLESVINTVIFDIEQETPAKKEGRYDFDLTSMIQQIHSDYKSIYDSKVDSFVWEETLEKYNKLLEYAQARPFDKGGDLLYQDSISLVKFRNHTVHPKPEMVIGQVETEPRSMYGTYEKLESALKGKGSKNPYHDSPIFEFFSADYSEWAVKTSIRFADEFFNRINSPPLYEHIITELGIQNLR